GLGTGNRFRVYRETFAFFVPLHLVTLDEVNNWLNQGLYFFKDIREQGIELFSEGTRELARPGNLTDEEKRAISQKHFDIWFKKAQDSFGVYKFTFNNPDYDIAKSAFELHQATRSPAGLYSSHLHQLPAQST
ncbi:hypothetical protein P4S72_08620, partial [Vibrio sp. PP-XX7]